MTTISATDKLKKSLKGALRFLPFSELVVIDLAAIGVLIFRKPYI